jgi:hypothetical protein
MVSHGSLKTAHLRQKRIQDVFHDNARYLDGIELSNDAL